MCPLFARLGFWPDNSTLTLGSLAFRLSLAQYTSHSSCSDHSLSKTAFALLIVDSDRNNTRFYQERRSQDAKSRSHSNTHLQQCSVEHSFTLRLQSCFACYGQCIACHHCHRNNRTSLVGITTQRGPPGRAGDRVQADCTLQDCSSNRQWAARSRSRGRPR